MKNKFFNQLRNELYFFTTDEIEEIIASYEEIISERLANGESETLIISSFESPKHIAKQYAQELEITTSDLQKYKTNFKHYVSSRTEIISQENSKSARNFTKLFLKLIQDLFNFLIKFAVFLIKLLFILEVSCMISGITILILLVDFQNYTLLFFTSLICASASFVYLQLFIYNFFTKKVSWIINLKKESLKFVS